MGLKKENYEVKDLGITLPQAYAVIRSIQIDGDIGTAEFVVQASRDLAFDKMPFQTETVLFTVNRDENPYKTAYEKAKEKSTAVVKNPRTGEEKVVESKMPFADWEDDITANG